MSEPGQPPPQHALPMWANIVLIAAPLLLLAIVVGFVFTPGGAPADKPSSTIETKLKEPGTALVMIKQVEQFKDAPERDRIVLSIGGARSLAEPFALYQHETRSEFHWQDGKLYACVEGDGRADQGAYWSDHVYLPDGGAVEIVKTCAGPRIDPGGGS